MPFRAFTKLDNVVEFNSSTPSTSIGCALLPIWCSPIAWSTAGRPAYEAVMLLSLPWSASSVLYETTRRVVAEEHVTRVRTNTAANAVHFKLQFRCICCGLCRLSKDLQLSQSWRTI